MFVHNQSKQAKHEFALGFQFILFMTVLIFSLIVNLVMLFICVGPIYGSCKARLRKREVPTFPSNSKGTLRILARQSLVPISKPMKPEKHSPLVSSCISNASNSASNRFARKPSNYKLEPLMTVKKIGRFTRYYFSSLCLANLILASLAMPFSIAACVGMKLTSTWIPELTGYWHNYSSIKLMEPSTYGFRVVHTVLVNYITCAFIESIVSGVTMAMILSLVHLTADRLIAICKPLHYARWITKKRAIISICILWGASFSLVIIPYIWEKFSHSSMHNHSMVELNSDIFTCFILGQHSRTKHYKFVICFFIFVYLLPVMFIVIAYIQIYITVRRFTQYLGCHTPKHRVTIDLEQSQTSSKLPTPRLSMQNEPTLFCLNDQSVVISKTPINRQHSWPYFIYKSREPSVNKFEKQRNQNAETKAAKTAFLLVTTFTILTAPYFFFVLVGASETNDCQNQVISSFALSSNSTSLSTNVSPIIEVHTPKFALSHCSLFDLATSAIVWLLYLNSILTPCLYAHRDGVLKHRLHHIWVVLKCSIRENSDDSLKRSSTHK